MADEIRPALSREEWRRVRDVMATPHPESGRAAFYVAEQAGVADRSEAVGAIALRALFTWEDVDRLRENAFNVPDGWSGNPWMEELADRIASLLPPREGKP